METMTRRRDFVDYTPAPPKAVMWNVIYATWANSYVVHGWFPGKGHVVVMPTKPCDSEGCLERCKTIVDALRRIYA